MVFPFLLPRGGCGELTSFKFRHVVAVCFCDITVVFNVAIFFVMWCVAFSQRMVLLMYSHSLALLDRCIVILTWSPAARSEEGAVS